MPTQKLRGEALDARWLSKGTEPTEEGEIIVKNAPLGSSVEFMGEVYEVLGDYGSGTIGLRNKKTGEAVPIKSTVVVKTK
jgi:hypothetical protein